MPDEVPFALRPLLAELDSRFRSDSRCSVAAVAAIAVGTVGATNFADSVDCSAVAGFAVLHVREHEVSASPHTRHVGRRVHW